MIIDRIKKNIDKNLELYILIIIPLTFAVLSYFWVPKKGYDLYEYYNWLDKLRNFNIGDTINFFIFRGEPVIMVYFLIIARIGNYQLLQVLPTFLFYFIALYILLDYAKLRKVPLYITIFVGVLLASLYEYVYIAGCFRYTLAFMIFNLALYLDYIKCIKKRWIWILYILPCLIHTGTFILLIFRFMEMLKNKKIKIAIITIIIICMLLPEIIIFPLSYISIEDFQEMNNKIMLYLTKWKVSFSLQYIYRIGQVILLVFISIFYDLKNKEENIFKEYNKYLYIIIIFSLLCIPYYSLFFRFNDFLLTMMLIKIMDLLNNHKIKKEKYFFYSLFIIFIIAGIRIQIPVIENMYFIK